MADMQLHCFAQSGNAYKCALMLQLCGVSWEPVFVDFFKGETRSPDYVALNAMGEVPILTHGDIRLSQSALILDYLAGHTGRFGARDEAEGREILRWLLWDNHKLTNNTATYRFLTNFAKGSVEPPVTEFMRKRMLTALKVLDTQLNDRPFIVGDRVTIADLSCCGYLFWDDEIGVSWDDHPNIGAWLSRLSKLEGWTHPYELMPGHPLPSADA